MPELGALAAACAAELRRRFASAEAAAESLEDRRFQEHTVNLRHLLPQPPLQTRESSVPAFAFNTWGRRATIDPSHRVRGKPLAPRLLTRERCPWALSGDQLLSVYALAAASVQRLRLSAAELARGLEISEEDAEALVRAFDTSDFLARDNNLHRADLARLYNAGLDPHHEGINQVGRAVVASERELATANNGADGSKFARNTAKRDKHFASAEASADFAAAGHAAAVAFSDACDAAVSLAHDELEHCEARRSLVFQNAPSFGEPVKGFRFNLPEVIAERPEGTEVLTSACISVPLVAVPQSSGSAVPSTNYAKPPSQWWQDAVLAEYLAANPPPSASASASATTAPAACVHSPTVDRGGGRGGGGGGRRCHGQRRECEGQKEEEEAPATL